ncbi:MAG: thiamine-phosphate kinase, partial [Candidatus Binatia bacterium]
AIDVSDGLLQDLGHLCRASRCGAVVEAERVPLAPSLTRLPRDLALALGGGEDYELVFTVPASREREVRRIDRRARRIGTIVRGDDVVVVDRSGREVSPATIGFDHFSRRSDLG